MFPKELPNPELELPPNALLFVVPNPPPDEPPKALFEVFAVLLPNKPPDEFVLDPKGFGFDVLLPKREVPVLELLPNPEFVGVSRFSGILLY